MSENAPNTSDSPVAKDVDPVYGHNLLPFPMSSIERFHWFDDSAAYPNVVFGKLVFDCAIDWKMAKRAWQLALGPHPFANVKPEKQWSLFGDRWQWNGESVGFGSADDWAHSKIEELTLQEVDAWSVKRHRCASPTGCYLGVYSSSQEDEAKAIFCIHHAVADGIACLKTINDWLVIYNNLVLEREPMEGVSRIDPAQIRQRSRLGLWSWSYLRNLPFQAIALFGAAKFMFRRTSSVIDTQPPRQESETEALPFPAIVTQWFSAEASSALEKLSGQWQVTSTTFLLGVWFETLAQVRREQVGRDVSNDWIRVILPMSIRSFADRRLPAANRTAIVQIDRQQPERSMFQQFVQMIHREVGIIRRFQLEKMFLILIRVFGVCSPLLKRVAANPTSRGAAVFTDLHRPFVIAKKRAYRLERVCSNSAADQKDGNRFVLPTDFELAGPIRRGTPLNLSIARYVGRLKLSLHFDQSQVSREQAEVILQRFVSNAEQWCAENSTCTADLNEA